MNDSDFVGVFESISVSDRTIFSSNTFVPLVMGTNCLSRFLPKMAAASRFPPKVSAVPRFAPKLVCISHRRKTFPNSKISMLMKLPAFNTNLHDKKINLKNFVIKTMCLNNCIYTGTGPGFARAMENLESKGISL